MTPVIGLLGGTFDPIHHGHLRLALECMVRAGCDGVRLIPAGTPPHRQAPVASARQRLRMARLAVAGAGSLVVDDVEQRRDGPSYTVETLEILRREAGGPLCLLLGADAFRLLPTWHRWRELLDLAHVIVATRPGAPAPDGVMAQLESEHGAPGAGALRERACGYVLRVELPTLDISSTRIRASIAAGLSVRYLVPDPVIEYIQQEGLYRNTP